MMTDSPAAVFARIEPGRKGEILGAAAEVFAEKGYDAGSMREIAARVGVSEPALYRHFEGKAAIFVALMHVATGRLRDEAFALIDSADASTLREQLVAAFADRRQALAFYGPVLRMVLSSIAHNPELLAEYRASVVLPMRERLTLKATELDAAFEVENADATRDSRVRALMALLVGFAVSSAVLGDEPDEAIADALMRAMEWATPPAPSA